MTTQIIYFSRLEVGAESNIWLSKPLEEHNCWKSSQSGAAVEE
jgi:hypothetical protein